jgi:hypothetical protein
MVQYAREQCSAWFRICLEERLHGHQLSIKAIAGFGERSRNIPRDPMR